MSLINRASYISRSTRSSMWTEPRQDLMSAWLWSVGLTSRSSQGRFCPCGITYELSRSVARAGSPRSIFLLELAFQRKASIVRKPLDPRSTVSGTCHLSARNEIDNHTGRVKASRDSAGVATTFRYDAMGRLVRTEPAAGAWMITTYDLPGPSSATPLS